MTNVMDGIRILDVAEHTFVPAASGILADWGAEVIKIEHITRGDAARGLGLDRHRRVQRQGRRLMEHANRGKKSLGLDLTSDEGRDILYRLAAISDVFLTNKMAGSAVAAADRGRRHPGPQPEHHLRAGHRLRQPRSRHRRRRVRLARVLGPLGRRALGHPVRPAAAGQPARTRVRRLHRRDDHRRWHLRRAAAPRAHRRGRRSSTCR